VKLTPKRMTNLWRSRIEGMLGRAKLRSLLGVRPGAATAEELMAFVAERVAPYKKIRRVEFIAAIPKSPSGKILRRLLRDLPAGRSLLPSG